MDTKICTVCGITKPLACFYKQAGCKDGHRPECKECKNLRGKDQQRRRYYQRKYGLSESIVADMVSKGCYVCGSHDHLHIDHNHDTGKVRGCLCVRCNHALGLMRDNPLLIRKLADYVEVADA